MLETLELETGARPTAAVIWLHGLGADGHDFEPIVPELDLPNALAVRFVFPHAPLQPVTINGGAVMRAWYDVYGIDGARREDETGVRASQAHVEALIARERDRGVPASRVVLAGFSQGGAITLHTGLRQSRPLAGLIALSCYLPLLDAFGPEAVAGSKSVPVFLAHGTQDPVVPLARGAASRDALQAAGYDVEWHEYPMPHSVCAEELRDIAAFMKRTLG